MVSAVMLVVCQQVNTDGRNEGLVRGEEGKKRWKEEESAELWLEAGWYS